MAKEIKNINDEIIMLRHQAGDMLWRNGDFSIEEYNEYVGKINTAKASSLIAYVYADKNPIYNNGVRGVSAQEIVDYYEMILENIYNDCFSGRDIDVLYTMSDKFIDEHTDVINAVNDYMGYDYFEAPGTMKNRTYMAAAFTYALKNLNN